MAQVILTRECCKPNFEREPLNQVNDVPQDELLGLVNKIEIVANFRKMKKAARCLCLMYVIGIIAFAVGGVVRHHR
jgi:hypothetical protein